MRGADIPYQPWKQALQGRLQRPVFGWWSHSARCWLAWGDGSFVKSLGTCGQLIEFGLLLCNADAGGENRRDVSITPLWASRGSVKSTATTMSMPARTTLALLLGYEQLCTRALLMTTMWISLVSAQDLRISSPNQAVDIAAIDDA